MRQLKIIEKIRNVRPMANALAMLWSSAGIAAAFGFLAQAIFARHFSVENYGLFAAASAAANMIGPAASFGVGLMWIQKYASEGWNARKWIKPSLKIAAIGTLVSTLTYILWGFTVRGHTEAFFVALYLSPMVAALGAVQLAESRYQLEDRFYHVATWQFAKQASLFLVALLSIVFAFDLLTTSASIGIAMAGIATMAFLSCRALINGTAAIKGHSQPNSASAPPPKIALLNVINNSWPFAATGFVYLIFFQSSIIVLLWLDTPSVAGIYGVSVAMISAVYLLPRILYRKLMMPRMFRWHYQNPLKLRTFFFQGVFGFALLSIPISVCLALFAPSLVHLFFGEKYGESAIIFQLFCICVPFRFFSTGAAAMVAEPGHIRVKLAWQSLVALLNILGNVLLIPGYSIYGAACTTIAVEIIMATLYFFLVRHLIFTSRAKDSQT